MESEVVFSLEVQPPDGVEQEKEVSFCFGNQTVDRSILKFKTKLGDLRPRHAQKKDITLTSVNGWGTVVINCTIRFNYNEAGDAAALVQAMTNEMQRLNEDYENL